MELDEHPAADEASDMELEKEYVRSDVAGFGMILVLAFLPAMAFGGILFAVFDLPVWTFILFAVIATSISRLYPLLRLDKSSLPLTIAGKVVVGRERRHWLIILAIIIVAELLLFVLRPYFIDAMNSW